MEQMCFLRENHEIKEALTMLKDYLLSETDSLCKHIVISAIARCNKLSYLC